MAEFIVYPELWGGRRHMGFIFTNSYKVSSKLCLLYEQLQEFKSQGITTWTQIKKNKNTVHNNVTTNNLKGKPTTKSNRVTSASSGYKTCSCHKVSKRTQSDREKNGVYDFSTNFLCT